MMIQLELGPEFQKTLAELGALGGAVETAFSRGLGKAVVFSAAHVVQNYLTGQSLKRRTGNLARYLTGWMIAPLEGVVGIPEKSAVDKYKYLLGDEDVTIRPKPGKNALIVPLPGSEALTAAGSSKWSTVKEAEQALGTHIFRLRGKNVLGYVRGSGKRCKFRALFALVKSVFVQGSGALIDGVLDSQDQMTDILQEEIDKVV
jgi:hypothetical protein